MNDLLLFLVTLIPLLGYIAKDVGARLEKETAHETRRRVATVSTIVMLYSMALTAIISEVAGSVPWGLLEGPALFIIQPVSTLILIFLASDSFGTARDTSKREEANKVKVADYIDQQLAGRLRPLEGVLVGVQNGLSELSALKPKVEKMSESVDALATTMLSQVKATKEIVEQYQLREATYREIAVQYDKWYTKRSEADLALKDLILGADEMLTRSYIVMDEMDDLIDLVEPPVSGAAGPAEAGTSHGQTPSPPNGGEIPPPVTHGKLTKVEGMANRERGNRAQLKFAEEVLHGAGKLLDNNIKEGTPDYVFYAPGSPETRKAKAVGAFKALTLREDGTRQRHIPRRKVLAELRMATKYAVPMILFVMNFMNGRIWAKVIPVNELKDFTGQTTPLWLVENDPQSEKACKETLQMALNLL